MKNKKSLALNPVEIAILYYVSSFGDHCIEPSSKIGDSMSRCSRTIRRSIKTLESKDLLDVKYTYHKKLKLSLTHKSRIMLRA